MSITFCSCDKRCDKRMLSVSFIQFSDMKLFNELGHHLNVVAYCLLDTKPLPEPILSHCPLNIREYIPVKFKSNSNNFIQHLKLVHGKYRQIVRSPYFYRYICDIAYGKTGYRALFEK